MKLQSPIPGAPFSSDRYGPRRPIDTDGDGTPDTDGFHDGQDFDVPEGTPIRAAGAGQVFVAGRQRGYGYAVFLDHGDGLTTRYAHMLAPPPVGSGWYVEAGDVIGYVGSTGQSTGAHLHFEVRQDGQSVDPIPYLTEQDEDMYTDADRKRDEQTAKQVGEIHWMLDKRVRPQLDRLEGVGAQTGRDGKTRTQELDEIHWMLEQRVRPALDRLTPPVDDDQATHPGTP